MTAEYTDDAREPNELILQQYALEKWWVEDQKIRDLEYNVILRESGRTTSDKNIRFLLQHLSEKMALVLGQRIEKLTVAANKGKGGVGRKTTQILRRLVEEVPIHEYELSYLVLSTAIGAVLGSKSGSTNLPAMSTILVDTLEQEIRIRAMLTLEPTLPKMVNKVLKNSRATFSQRKKVFTYLFHKRVKVRIRSPFTNNHSRIETGNALMELLFTLEGSQMIEAVKLYDTKKRDYRWVFKPSRTLLDIFNRDMSTEWLAKRTNPFGILLYPPSPRQYPHVPEMLLTKDCPPIKVSPLAGKKQSTIVRLAETCEGYEKVLQCLSYLESVPLRVNQSMLSYVINNKDQLKEFGMLASVNLQLPDCPLEKGTLPQTDKEHLEFSRWKRHMAATYDKYFKERQHVLKESRTIELAERLQTCQNLYYRWHADFRGRLYTLNTLLSFQGGPLAKCLLEFGEPVLVDVGNPDDKAWSDLVEYGLRLMSEFSKSPQDHFDRFKHCSSALEGLTHFTLLALPDYVSSKDTLPFIAWCLEMKRLLPYWGRTNVTHHPIRKDATCSSMQHMAALAGDLPVLKAVNCTAYNEDNNTLPKDLYTTIIPNWVELGLERKWIKSFVMTLAYNSTDYTRTKELRENATGGDHYRATQINERVKKATIKGLGLVIDLQKWLMEVFEELVMKQKQVAASITPLGFILSSSKYEYPSRDYAIHTLQTRLNFKMKDVDSEDRIRFNSRATRQAWVANIIHSLDACLIHGMLYTLFSAKSKMPLVPIHDCIVSRPGDMTSIVLPLLNSSWKRMYTPALRQPSDGIPWALENLMDFWGLKTTAPKLYWKAITTFKAPCPGTYDNLHYFFL